MVDIVVLAIYYLYGFYTVCRLCLHEYAFCDEMHQKTCGEGVGDISAQKTFGKVECK